MKPYRLVDLYLPAGCASLEECAEVASKRGLAALVYVASQPDQLPAQDTLTEVQSTSGILVYPAYEITGCGSRVLALMPNWEEVDIYESLNAIEDPVEVVARIHDAGGAALYVCPHADPTGAAKRDAPALHKEHTAPGVICMMSKASRLVRDLDCEHANANGRRILAGTGPFGQLEDVGRFSTLFARTVTSRAHLIDSLRSGHGTTVELGPAADEPAEEPAPQKRKRRRRRRRGGKPKTANDAGGEPSSE